MRSVAASILLVSLVACGDPAQEPAAKRGEATPDPANPLGFAVWHKDLPYEVPLSPQTTGHWYDRTRRQALEKVVANLQGNCTRDAWEFARSFFTRAPAEARPLLVEAMERAFHAPDRGEIVENSVEAMGACADPALAPALVKALTHPRDGVRDKAMRALVRSGTKEALLAAKANLRLQNSRAQTDWVRAAAAHLGDALVAEFGAMLADREWAHLHRPILDETKGLDPERARAILAPLFAGARGDMRVLLGALLHMKGDPNGTSELRAALRSDKPTLKAVALDACPGTDRTWLLEEILKCTIDDDATVRQKAALALADVPGENVERTLAILALDADDVARRNALWALQRRGNRKALDDAIEVVRTGTGSRLRDALEDLASAHDGVAVPAIFARYEQASGAEARDYLRVIAYTRSPDAFPYLKRVFLGPVREFGGDARLTTLSYTPVILANLTGCHAQVIELFRALPRADHVRRAHLLHTLGNMVPYGPAAVAPAESRASASSTRASQPAGAGASIYALYREILLDRAEAPQIRLLALLYLRKDLTLDDVPRIRSLLEGEEEPMRKALNAFLFEFF